MCINFSGEILSFVRGQQTLLCRRVLDEGKLRYPSYGSIRNTQFYGMYIGITDSGRNEVISTLEPYFVLHWLKYALPYFVE